MREPARAAHPVPFVLCGLPRRQRRGTSGIDDAEGRWLALTGSKLAAQNPLHLQGTH
ncbi:MAG: hypothetical protein JWO56_456 [Acidobacteria bacterium]|nr:hypothetical protein [Acidobacteriota bacterium]